MLQKKLVIVWVVVITSACVLDASEAASPPATLSYTVSGNSQCTAATTTTAGTCTAVTIQNTSTSAIAFKPSVQTDTDDFTVNDSACTGAPIDPNKTCDIIITLNPKATGSPSSQVTLLPMTAHLAGKTFLISVGPNASPCEVDGGGGTAQVSGANVLQGFSTTFNSGATLASASILNAYLNQGIFPHTSRCSPFNAISVDISATAEATSASFTDYAKAEFLGLRNGLINIYFNPFAGRNASITALQWNNRDLASDHIYMKNPWTSLSQKPADQISDDQLLGFWLFGLGGRGVKTAENGTNLAAVGTLYAGFGADSPIHDLTLSGSNDPSQWGGVSFQAFATFNVANRGTLEEVFYPTSTSTPGHPNVGSTYETVGASFTLWMPLKLYFKLEYNKGIGSPGSAMGDTASLSFGYGSATTAKSSAANANPNATK